MTRLLVLVLGLMWGSAACAEAVTVPENPRHGLMWHRSGLPAVFPLVVKTRKGRDYLLTLIEAETGNALLAAYINGGTFFRVLAPPGTFRVRFDYGTEWQDDVALFAEGEASGVLYLEAPLTFAARGPARKTGYVVDLTAAFDEAGQSVIVRSQDECQRIGVARFPRPQAPFGEDSGYASRLTEEGALVRNPAVGYDPERDSRGEDPAVPTRHAPYLSQPEFKIRTVPCP